MNALRVQWTRLTSFVLLAGLLLISVQALKAQLPTGTISGQVHDASAAAIPGATVTATNRETGAVRSTQSGPDGRFTLPAMMVGVYDVKAEAPAFRAEVQQNLTLTVGQEAVLNFALQVGSVTEAVTVMAEAPLVETTSGALGGLVGAQQVSDLPLNGRNFNDLVLLQTGITVHKPVSLTSTTATGLAYSSNGAPIRSNSIMMDGANIVAGGGINGVSVSGSMLGIEAIREFRVITNSFPAEYGMTMGSQTTVVTKSGTNQVHGSVFEFLRNSGMDARDFFDRKRNPTDPRIPDFRRNNFGGAVGGPIVTDKQFFHLSYEGVRESKGITQTLTVPATAIRSTAVAAVRPYLDLYPLPTESILDVATGQPSTQVGRFSYIYKRPTREDFGQARWDYNLSEKDMMFARYTIVDSSRTNAVGFPQFSDFATSRGQYMTFSENHTFSPAVLNMLRLSFLRSFQNYDSPSEVSLGFLPGIQMGSIAPGSGVTSLGPIGSRPLGLNQNQYSLGNDVLWTRGNHTIKFGTLINKFHVYTNVGTNARGTWTFNNLAAFLSATPRQLVILSPGSVTDRTYRWETYGFYGQDDWRVSPKFTLNLGLRYEFTSKVNETKGRGSSLRNVLTDTAFAVAPELFDNPSMTNISPRLGFAWDVLGNASTSVRGGFGLLYDVSNITGAAQVNATATPPFSSSNTVQTNLTFPVTNVPSRTRPEDFRGVALRLIDYNLQQPHMLQYNLTVERQLPANMVVSVAYAGSRGLNLYGTKEGNPAPPSSVINGREFWSGAESRLNPFWADMEFITAGMDSWYNSFQFGFEKRMAHGLQFKSAYTWSKALDTTQGQHGGESGGAPNQGVAPHNPSQDKGPADFDTRHSWTVNALYQIPSLVASDSMASYLLNGWRVSTIFTAKTGLPFTPLLSGNRSRSKANGNNADHPDAVAGRDADSIILGGPDRFFDPSAFTVQPVGFLGTSGRNQLTGPSQVNVDLSLTKEARLGVLGEQGKLEFRAEMFNLFNHANFNIPVNGRTVFTANETAATLTPLATAGQIDRTVSSNRQVQLALKLIF
jgi:outer membrane receptor protein involved in Fe transport